MLGLFGVRKGSNEAGLAYSIFIGVAILIGCGGGGGGGGTTGATGASTGATTASTSATTTGTTTGTTTSTSTGTLTGSTTGTTGSAPFSFYFGSDAGGPEKAYRISSDGSGRVAVNTGANAVSQVAVNRAGTKLAFVVWTNYKHIFVVNPDGTGMLELTPGDWDSSWPAFSPDGSKILFTSYENGTPQLWTMNADGTNKAELTSFADGAIQGRYSPNGQKIVYVTGSLNDDVWVMNANGSSPLALAAGPTEDENEPAFNHDGTKVIFVKVFDNSGDAVGQIHSVNASGGSSTRLTTDLQDDREPVVSLDGLTILFSRPFGPGRDIFKMSISGANQVRVTNEAALSASPSAGN